MKKEPEFYAGSKVPKIDSCVTEIVYDTTNSSDGNYIYYFRQVHMPREAKYLFLIWESRLRFLTLPKTL